MWQEIKKIEKYSDRICLYPASLPTRSPHCRINLPSACNGCDIWAAWRPLDTPRQSDVDENEEEDAGRTVRTTILPRHCDGLDFTRLLAAACTQIGRYSVVAPPHASTSRR